MRVVVADPPAYTPPYDRSLCAALARAGVNVELITSRFRFGAPAEPMRYEAKEWFYPLSSRMPGTRLRLAVKALEHPLGMARFGLTKADVIHMQWLGAPELDRWLFRPHSPAVLTAHDIIPRRTLSKTAMWRALFERFERIVVHSERGRGQLVDFGLPAEKVRVIPHPVFRSEVDRRDDGRRALSEATVGLFPYREEIDLSGALLQVLGAGVPAIVYDIGGLGELVGRFEAGAVVPAGDDRAMSDALRRLLGDANALAAARRGAERARDELTWEAAAAAHLDLYRELA